MLPVALLTNLSSGIPARRSRTIFWRVATTCSWATVVRATGATGKSLLSPRSGARPPSVLGWRSSMTTPRPRIVLLQGAFDILNYGHIRAFKFAKSLGDYLIVAL